MADSSNGSQAEKSFGKLRMVSSAEPFVSSLHPCDESRGIIARNKKYESQGKKENILYSNIGNCGNRTIINHLSSSPLSNLEEMLMQSKVIQLTTDVRYLPLVGPVYARRLKRLNIETVQDLLLHVPHRYLDFRKVLNIYRDQIGEIGSIKGKIESIKNIYTVKGRKIQIAQVMNADGNFQAVWFNQPFLVKTIREGESYSFSGKIDWFNRKKTLVSPEYENIEGKSETIHTGRLIPIYPETSRVSSKWLRGRIAFAFESIKDTLEEYLPAQTLTKLIFPNIKQALELVHFPKELQDPEKGLERLSFDELLFHQLKSLYRKGDWTKIKAIHSLKVDRKIKEEFIDSLPYKLTESQVRSVNEIIEDLSKDYPMNRLLEGDVGSGKTVVAALGAFVSFVEGYQCVFMAPTQILAQQHFDTLKSIFDKFKVRVSLVTSSGVKKDLGKTDIFVGTHALIHKKVEFDKVAYVVIDEQHRFGVEQRAHLVKKAKVARFAPHVLTMTATPIPRSIALTIYGDLDLSTLDELPHGRRPITTWLVPPQKRDGAYQWSRKQIHKDGIQVFVICPLIEESVIETMKQVKAATAEYETLKNVYSDLNFGLLHGKQTAKVKNAVLDDFRQGKTHILVSTPVVEVGIDIPNATIMIIEGAERYGLSQLHQLRGRVGRGEKKSYCLLFTESRSVKVLSRLNALRKNLSGKELAELDLQLRGPGEIFGTLQHGFPELKIASWQDTKLIKIAREVAKEAIDNPQNFSKLIQKIESQNIAPN